MKDWYKSKTIWLNAAAGLTTLLAAVATVLPSLQGLFSIETYLIVSAIVNVANIVLRKYFTDAAITK